jgi:hypothetical protein
MRISKNEVPIKMAVPGATARQITEFGDASGFAALAGEYFSLAAGTDIGPLLQGLEADSCQAPHWGYIIGGRVIVTYTNATEDVCEDGDLFYWPPGHSVRVERDAEVILFSPQKEHVQVLDHMLAKLSGN